MSENRTTDITYEMICQATNGDKKAMEEIVDCFEAYIKKLSKETVSKTDGNLTQVINRELYMGLKLKLIEVIKKFRVDDYVLNEE